jgi:hypothetical protein
MQTEIYVLIGIIAAVIWRTLYPYLQKLQENPGTPFDLRYILIALFTSAATAFIIFPTILPGIDISGATPVTIIAIAFFAAYTAQDIGTAASKGKTSTTLKNTVIGIKFASKEERITKKIDELNKMLAEEKNKKGENVEKTPNQYNV